MKYCQRCGKAVPDNVLICDQCMGLDYQEPPVQRKKRLPAGAIVGIILGSVAMAIIAIVLVVGMFFQVKSIDITDSDVFMDVGDVYKIRYVLEPEYTFQKDVTYSSSNPDIATVDSDGRITAKKDGEVTIEVLTKNGQTDSINVVVSQLFDDWYWESVYMGDSETYYTDTYFTANMEINENRFRIEVFDMILEGEWEFEEYDGEDVMYYFRDDEGGGYSVIVSEELMAIMLIDDPPIVVFYHR